MRKFLVILVCALVVFGCKSKSSAEKEVVVHVWGNNEKCKVTIEKAAKLDGVSEADWHIDSKLMTLVFDTTKVGLNTILESVAHAGYDNERFYANDYAYGALDHSCQYERRPFESK